MGYFDFTNAIVRRPGESAVQGLCAGGGPCPSIAGLRAEHAAYVDALESLGVAVETLDPLETFPDSMFIEDPALTFAEAAILLRPGAPSRQGEAAMLEPVLRQRFERVLVLDEGHVDGGDVLATPDIVFIGRSGRTDEPGARHLAALLGELGREARIVATPPGTLHLKSDCALIAADTVLAAAALAASGLFEGFRIMTAPEGEESSANLVRIGGSVLVGDRFPRTTELIASLGLAPVPLATAEIARLDAGLSCMSLRW